jgi:hypothetical protein
VSEGVTVAGKAGEVFVEVVADLSKFGNQLSKDVDKSVSSKASQMGKSFQRVGAGLTAGVTLPIVGLGIAASKAFQESAAVAAQTDAAIKSTGGAAGVTAAHISDLATAVSGYSAQDDEAIQAGENMLLTFTGITNAAGKHNDVFDQTTRVMADYAQATGTDATSAALSLGKALNDPTKGLSKLGKQGVVFTDQQAKAIAKMQEAGDLQGAQKVILRELTKEFGGSAKAFGDSAAGSSKKASVAIGNAMEDIGGAIAPAVSKLAGLIATFAEWFGKLSGPWKTAIVVFLAVLALVGPVLGIIGTAMTGLGAIGTAFGISMAAAFWWVILIVAAAAAIIALAIVVIKNWSTIKRVTLAVWNAIKGFLLGIWKAIKSAALAVWNGIRDVFVAAFNGIKAIVLGYLNLYKVAIINPLLWVWAQIKKILGWISDHWREVWNGLKDSVTGIWEGIVAAVKTGANFVLGIIEEAVNAFLQPFQTLSTAPIIGSKIPDVPEIHIPRLASGAIVSRATLAVVGEAGPEAVVPLSHLRDFAGAGRAVAISGTLALSPDSTAYVRGVIDEDADARGRHARTLSRMRGGRS